MKSDIEALLELDPYSLSQKEKNDIFSKLELDVKLDNRKTKNLDPNKNKAVDNKIDLVLD